MLGLIKQYLANPETKNLQIVTPNNENLLNRIIWGQFISDLVLWYNGKQETFIKEGFQKNAMVFAIEDKIAKKLSSCDLQVFKRSAKSKQYKNLKYSGKDLELAQSRLIRKAIDYIPETDPFFALLNNPNPYQTRSEFLTEVSYWKGITGEVFIYGVGPGEDSRNFGRYQEMYCLPSHLVEIKLNTLSFNISDPILGYKLIIGDQWITIPKEDVLHIKYANLDWDLNGTQLRGMSPYLPASTVLQKNNLGIEAGAKSNKNQGAKGILSPSITNPEMYMDAVQMEKFRQGIEKRVNGTDNREKIQASGMPLQFAQIGMSSRDMELIGGLQYDDEKLCGVRGVHPVLFRPTATRAELEVAQKALVTDVVMPELNLLEQKLAGWLNPKFGTDYVIEFDTSSYPELQPDLKLIMDAYKDNETITKNELRIMLGFDEMEGDGANTLWVGSNKLPIEEAFGGGNTDFGDFGNA